MENVGNVIVEADMMAGPGAGPTGRWYAQRWEEPRETKMRPASQHRVRQAVARALFAVANGLAAPEQQERVSA